MRMDCGQIQIIWQMCGYYSIAHMFNYSHAVAGWSTNYVRRDVWMDDDDDALIEATILSECLYVWLAGNRQVTMDIVLAAIQFNIFRPWCCLAGCTGWSKQYFNNNSDSYGMANPRNSKLDRLSTNHPQSIISFLLSRYPGSLWRIIDGIKSLIRLPVHGESSATSS